MYTRIEPLSSLLLLIGICGASLHETGAGGGRGLGTGAQVRRPPGIRSGAEAPATRRVRERRLGENMAWLYRFTLSLLKRHRGRQSLAMKRRCCGWDVDFLLEVLARATPW